MQIGVWQGGDGKRYMVNPALMFQTCAATAAIDARNKFATVGLTGLMPSLKGLQRFEHVQFDAKAAEAYRAVSLRQYYDDIWRTFQAPGRNSGEAVVQQLMHLRALASRCSAALNKKFGQVSDTNKASLGTLDNQLLGAQVVRDTGFTIVIALSTGGAGTIGTIGAGSRVLIAGSAIATKAGTKVYDIQNTVTDSAERNGKYGSVILGTGMDILFSGISLASGTLNVGQQLILAASIKAPAEGIKSALDGGTGQQIAFSVGFEAFAPLLEGVGAALATKLFPRFVGCVEVLPMTEATRAASLAAAQHVGGQAVSQSAAAIKDGWILPLLGQSTQGASAINRFLDQISVFAANNGSDLHYFRQCVIKAVP